MSIANIADSIKMVPGEYNTSQSDEILSKFIMLVQVKSKTLVVKSVINGTVLVSSNKTTTIKYGAQAVSKLIECSDSSASYESSNPSFHSVLGNNQPLLAVITATIRPVNEPKIATNSAPNKNA